jgi:hypothetical protein
MGLRDAFRGFFSRTPKAPATEPVGAPSTAIYGGHVQTQERSPDLQGSRKWKTYADVVSNVAIVATAIRLRLELLAKPRWTCKPPNDLDTLEAWEWSERGEAIFADMATPMPQAVQRSGLFVDYGYGIQTWSVKRNDEGWFVLDDLRPIGCATVERWDCDEYGRVEGVEQLSPQTQERIYIPRKRMIYNVDKALNDSPEGLGMLRQIVEEARLLVRKAQIEMVGFDSDLAGTPKARAPIAELNAAVYDGSDPHAEAHRTAIMTPIDAYMKNHNRSAKTGILLDSSVYTNADGTPSTVYKSDIELLQTSGGNLPALDVSIMRSIKMMALVYGAEGLLIGMESTGAYALAKDKTTKLHLLIDSLLGTLCASYQRDVLDEVWALNGWPMEYKPELEVEPVNRADVEQVVAVLDGLSRSGIMMRTDDAAIDKVRGLVDLPPQPPSDPAIEGLLTQLTRPDAEGNASGELDANPEPFVPTAPAASMELEPAKDAQDVAARVTAATALIRAGFEPEASLVAVGLGHIDHSGMSPITVKPREQVDAEAEAALAEAEG